jgi:nucleotide-binding universal stress UspA family protein
MKRIIAALDNDLAAGPVIATAKALGALLSAEVEAVHVASGDDRVARRAAETAGLELDCVGGPVAERLLARSREQDVAALVIGCKATAGGRQALGSTALAVATALEKPVVVVPPDAAPPARLGRVLVPVEGGGSKTPRGIVELVRGAEIEVVVLHVREEASLPSFTDQPQHEQQAGAREFLRRYCPWGIGAVQLEIRVGRSDEIVPLVAAEKRVDLIALGWSQELAEGQAPVVRAALARGRTPVMLVPVQPASGRGRLAREPVRAVSHS